MQSILCRIMLSLMLGSTTFAEERTDMKAGDESIAGRVEHTDPETGRKIIQLTAGNWFDYHLYYYIPTVTADGRSIVFHRYRDGQVQYHRLDLDTGKTVCLTSAMTPNALWRPWEGPAATGVREFLGAFSQARNELVYFDSNEIHGVDIYTLKDRLIATLPADRHPCGLTGISPDGRHFVFPHADRAWWDAHSEKAAPPREAAKRVGIEVLDLETGQMRPLLFINCWITHTNFFDNQRVLFCHPATEMGVMIADLRGSSYTMVRAQNGDSRQIVHYQATTRGVMYEYNNFDSKIDRSQGMIGISNADTMEHTDYRLDARITHIGFDPEGRLWFGERLLNGRRQIGYFASLRTTEKNRFIPLVSDIKTYGWGQRSHTHPLLMPDRRHILFAAGDEKTQSTHLFMVDVSDVKDTNEK